MFAFFKKTQKYDIELTTSDKECTHCHNIPTDKYKKCEDCFERNQQCLFLVPEIGLTAALHKRLEKRLGMTIPIIHSSISEVRRQKIYSNFLSIFSSLMYSLMTALSYSRLSL